MSRRGQDYEEVGVIEGRSRSWKRRKGRSRSVRMKECMENLRRQEKKV